jgi:hypothetical protein
LLKVVGRWFRRGLRQIRGVANQQRKQGAAPNDLQ